jgi:phage shock protein A
METIVRETREEHVAAGREGREPKDIDARYAQHRQLEREANDLKLQAEGVDQAVRRATDERNRVLAEHYLTFAAKLDADEAALGSGANGWKRKCSCFRARRWATASRGSHS